MFFGPSVPTDESDVLKKNSALVSVSPLNRPSVSHLTWSDLLVHHDYLVQFARRRLLDKTFAQDMVHDVFEAVISGRANFAGRAELRSWLTAVLKNKIVDLVRDRVRFESQCSVDSDIGEGNFERIACQRPAPDVLAENRQLLQATLEHIGYLPVELRDVMRLRVLQDESTDAACKTLNITETCLNVRLHRARKQLLFQSQSFGAMKR
jgi:RNA polymerase sigma-70 factor, ECF subfamily